MELKIKGCAGGTMSRRRELGSVGWPGGSFSIRTSHTHLVAPGPEGTLLSKFKIPPLSFPLRCSSLALVLPWYIFSAKEVAAGDCNFFFE